ncbi:hypothetical protein ACU5DF_13385 [Aliivibrio wodanis]|uniref:hypothetical protein n=1 Tax=Aliivibrio wodanis TaxID=80852 RepID=UPI00406CD5B9
MLIQKNGIFLCLATLFISGCNDKLDITFNQSVGLVEETEIEITEALKGIAIIDNFEWRNKPSDYSEGEDRVTWYKVRLEMSADELNPNYSIPQISKIIKNHFAYQEQDITLTIDIFEKNKQILKTLAIEEGVQIATKLDWKKARTNIFYFDIDKETFSYQSKRNFVCAISVPLKTKIPTLTYQYHQKPELDGIEIIRANNDNQNNLTFEALNLKKLTGLPVDDDLFTIKLQSTSASGEKYGKAFLIFKHLGDTRFNKYAIYDNVSVPDNATKEMCEELLKVSTNSNLFGAAGHFTANGNIRSIRMVY